MSIQERRKLTESQRFMMGLALADKARQDEAATALEAQAKGLRDAGQQTLNLAVTMIRKDVNAPVTCPAKFENDPIDGDTFVWERPLTEAEQQAEIEGRPKSLRLLTDEEGATE